MRTIVVGGGIVGLATAYRVLQRYPDSKVVVLERENRVGAHQSTHNSGVLHAGLYYRPGSLKARLAVAGIRQMKEFCEANGITYESCGKLVTATETSEIPRLRELESRGHQNGLRGIRWLEKEALREIEPHCAGIAAVHVPEEGIVDYGAVCRALAKTIERRGGEVRTDAAVRRIQKRRSGWVLETSGGPAEGEFLIGCAGLHSDRVAAMAGHERSVRIIPFRGEYFFLRPERRHLVRNLIYPVPDPVFPFLGVHFTRTTSGGVEAGPNAVLALSRHGYRRGAFSPKDAADALTYPGLWRFVQKHAGMCWSEVRRSYSRKIFCRSLQRLVPEVEEADLLPGEAGVRAQAMTPGGDLVYDFVISRDSSSVHILNAPSPGATAALAIGDHIASLVGTN